MKSFKIFIIIPMLLYLLAPFNAYSQTTDEIETKHIDKSEIKGNYSVTLLQEKPESYTIDCFDADENGNVVIVTENISDYFVSVYDNDFNFKYALTFPSIEAINVKWDNDDVTIYYHRGNTAVSYNALGQITTVSQFDDTVENDIAFNNLDKPLRQSKSNEYKLQNNLGFLNLLIGQTSYSQLVKIDEQGNEALLYDTNLQQLGKVLLFSAFFIGGTTAVIVSIIKKGQ